MRVPSSHAAPGHHFASRAELLAELAADGFAALADALEAAMAASEPPASRSETGKAYVRIALANPQRYRLMFASRLLAGECPPRLQRESRRAYHGLLRAVGGSDHEVDLSRYRLGAPELASWSIVHGAVMLWLDGQLGAIESEAAFVELMSSVLDDRQRRP
jgi:AcrR family transcriptional regulator